MILLTMDDEEAAQKGNSTGYIYDLFGWMMQKIFFYNICVGEGGVISQESREGQIIPLINPQTPTTRGSMVLLKRAINHQLPNDPQLPLSK